MIFTICSNNYLPAASVLVQSIRQHQPAVDVVLCLADRISPALTYPDGAGIVEAERLGIPDFPQFSFRYTILEFSTAVKPFAFLHLFAAGYDEVCYLDPDIEVFASLDRVFAPLGDGGSFVLTPHLLAPDEGAHFPGDIGVMRAGIYNLGFLAVRAEAHSLDIVRWWARRLERDCVAEPDKGMFVDQRFMDLVPGFSSAAAILRDPTLNVAYWNLQQRSIEGDAESGWTVEGKPLTFFHFSGFDPKRPDTLTRHSRLFRDGMPRPVSALLQAYATKVLAMPRARAADVIPAFDRFKSGAPIPDTARRFFRENHPEWVGDPFENFEATWRRLRNEALEFTRLESAKSQSRTLLDQELAAFPTPGESAGGSLLRDAGAAARLDPLRFYVVAGLLNTYAPHLSRDRRPQAEGAGVYGYFGAEAGLGQAARGLVRGLRMVGVPTSAHHIVANFENQVPFATSDDQVSEFRSVVLLFPAVVLLERLRELPFAAMRGRRRIGYWPWELPVFPAKWARAFDLVHEIWAPSTFNAQSIAGATDLPVRVVPHPVELAAIDRDAARDLCGLPRDAFIFLTAFDTNSFPQRKNPAGAIRAFLDAFPARGASAPLLVVKCHGRAQRGAAFKEMVRLVAADPRIVLIDEVYSTEKMQHLQAACDSFVSLHRSEGFGLNIAECMGFGKPCIATAFSGNLDFMTDLNSIRVPYRVCRVGPGEYIGASGQWWADPVHDAAVAALQFVANGGMRVRALALNAKADIARDLSIEAVGRIAAAALRGESAPIAPAD